jgi:hypothetical protein
VNGIVHIRASITCPRSGKARLERAGLLTPYELETIAEDALGAGRGARLEVTLPAHTANVDLTTVEQRLGRLRSRGLDVRVRRLRNEETDEDAA